MKNTLKQIVLAIAVITAASLQAGAADTLEKAVGLGLKAAALSPKTGCNTMGAIGGRNLKTMLVSSENQQLAQILCCEEPAFKEKHPKAFESLCKGTSTNKATELLINNIDKVPSKACPALGQLGRGLSALTDAQKKKVCTTCKTHLEKHPKALEAVCTGAEEADEDILADEELTSEDVRLLEDVE